MKKTIIFHDKPGKALTPQKKIDQHNLPFTLNSTIGCLFGCAYCYLQGFPFNLHTDFGKEVKVKTWISERLDFELDKYRNLPQYLKRVQVSVASEGYLPDVMIKTKRELNRDIMAEILETFKRHWEEGNCWMVHLITKSHMVLKHLNIVQNMRNQVQLELTITTLNEERKKILEKYAPSVKRRLDIIRKFSDAGIFVRIMCMPLLGTREEAEELRQICFDNGARAFKHKGVNYFDENALLAGEVVSEGGREDEVFEDLLVKSGEPVIENGEPMIMTVQMPTPKWNEFEYRDMVIKDTGYTEMNDIDWEYLR
jgi:DNA repair photolyase